MGKIKTLSLITFFFFISMTCFAKQVAFQIVQHDGTHENVSEQSFVVEDTLLNSFFEYGYIVTNSAASVSGSEEQDALLLGEGIKEALEGFSDFFVQVRLYYTVIGSSQNVCLKRIEWSITSLDNSKVLVQKAFDVQKDYLTNDELQKISTDISVEIRKSLKA